MEIVFRGKMSTFGGPDDRGVGPDEGLALVDSIHFPDLSEYFLPRQPPGTTGLARRLNPETFYIACRWNYVETSKSFLRRSLVTVRNPENGQTAQAKPVDWGPAARTGRVTDLSPGLAHYLDLRTDDQVEVTLSTASPDIELADAVDHLRVFTNDELRHYFGAFTYRPDPAQRGGIIINPPWSSQNLVEVVIPTLIGLRHYGRRPFNGKVTCHHKIASDLQLAFQEIERRGLSGHILFWGGSFVPRHLNWDPARNLSSHSWGVTFDINVEWNGYGAVPAPVGAVGSVRELVPIFEAFGFAWGGNFSSPDGMHFEYARIPQIG